MEHSFLKTIVAVLAIFPAASAAAQTFPYLDPELGIDERINDLVPRLSLEEKAAMMQYASPAVPSLGIPAYNWWNECLHGVGRSQDKVTVFPQAIAMAAAFDEKGMEKTGEIISTEARAIYNEARRTGKVGMQYKGLTFWTPNINIFRDPRWGRGQETYGEDPYLTAVLGKAIVRGLQGSDSVRLKTSACAKHFAVHSGPESSRHTFDAEISDYDLWDTYLPAFRALVTEGKVSSVMGAYNRFRGQPCCASDLLMTEILRGYWGFDGYPLYPFGFGLSYTTFEYDTPVCVTESPKTGGTVRIASTVRNTGDRTGDEVVQLYISHPDAPEPKPTRALKGIKRVTLAPGEEQTVYFELDGRDLSLVDAEGNSVCSPGRVSVYVGGAQPETDDDTERQSAIIRIKGGPVVLAK